MTILVRVQASEIDQLMTWYDPLGSSDMAVDQAENLAMRSKYTSLTPKQWRDNVDLAWSIAPSLAVQLPSRCGFDSVIDRSIDVIVLFDSEIKEQHTDMTLHWFSLETWFVLRPT